MDQGYFANDRQDMLPFVPARRSRVLDVGCGEGRFSGSLPGVEEIWGIEPSSAARVAMGRMTRVLNSTFDEAELELPKQYFDLVICNDVIEHMPNHSRFLSSIGQYIAPGGMMIGSIPNVRYYNNLFQYMIEKDWYYTDSGILDRTHLAFFTQKSLRRTLEQHGFEVVRLTGIHTGARPDDSARARVYQAVAYALVVSTLGYFSDIRHFQLPSSHH